MATAARSSTRTSGAGPSPYRLTVRQFNTMIDVGVLTEDDRVELLGGLLAEQMTKNAPHEFAVGRLRKHLEATLGREWLVRQESALTFGRYWRPEPDVAVVVGPDDRYRSTLPSGAEVLLVVEVAESSYATDRGAKWHGYAAAGVPVYWIVDLSKRLVEVYAKPVGRGKAARYREAATFEPGDEIAVAVSGRESGAIAVNAILP